MITKAWRIIERTHTPALLCLLCDRLSYNPNDIKEHYCGACHAFLDDVPRDFIRPEERPTLETIT